MTEIDMPARVIDGSDYETVHYPADEIRLRVTHAGNVQITEYISDDRDGPPPHTHEWDEIEYVIDGEVDFLVNGTWTRGGPGTTQLLPKGAPHSVRVPRGAARILMITIGAPFDGFARDLAAYYARDGAEPSLEGIVEVAARHGVRPATV